MHAHPSPDGRAAGLYKLHMKAKRTVRAKSAVSRPPARCAACLLRCVVSEFLVFAHFILTANNLPSSKLLLNHVHWSAHMLGATADGAAALVECSREERLGTAVSGVMKLSVSQLAIWMISHRALPKLQRWNASLSKRLPEVMFRWLFWQGGLTVRVRVPPPYLCSQTSR